MTCVFLLDTSLQAGPQDGETTLGTHEIAPLAAPQNFITEQLLLEKYGFILDNVKNILAISHFLGLIT